MKKLLYLFILVATISCSSDDDNSTPATESSIVGTWILTQFETSNISTTTFEGETISIESTITGEDYDLTFTFSENPNEYISSGEFTQVLEFTDPYGEGSETIRTVTSAADQFSSGTWAKEYLKIIKYSY